MELAITLLELPVPTLEMLNAVIILTIHTQSAMLCTYIALVQVTHTWARDAGLCAPIIMLHTH